MSLNEGKQKYLVRHVKYNREVVYNEKVEMGVEEFVEMLERDFSEKDLEYLEYHNPTLKKMAGEEIHPNARIEQILGKKNFYIELV